MFTRRAGLFEAEAQQVVGVVRELKVQEHPGAEIAQHDVGQFLGAVSKEWWAQSPAGDERSEYPLGWPSRGRARRRRGIR